MGKNREAKKIVLLVYEKMNLSVFRKLFDDYSTGNHLITTNSFNQAVNWSNIGKKFDEVILHEDFIEEWKHLTKSDAHVIPYKKVTVREV